MLFAGDPTEGNPLKRLVVTLVTSAFALVLGIALLSGPATAVAHPGNTCNPAPGHGNTGCHRVAASSGTAAQTKAKTLARHRAAQHAAAARAAAARTAAAKKRATAKAAPATAAAPPAPAVVTTAPATALAIRPATAPVPWWIALWHFLVG